MAVVASDAGGLPEVVEHGVTGLVVPRGDSDRPGRGDRRRCWPTRSGAAADGTAPAASARSGCSTGIARPSSSSRSTATSARGRAGERSAVRVSLGRRSSGLRHRRAAPDPGRVPRFRRAQHLLRQHGPLHQPAGMARARASARSKAKLADREAVHLIKKTGWPRFLLETALSRPVGLSASCPTLQALQAEGHELGLHGGMDHVDLEPPVPPAARRGSARRTWRSPTATSSVTSGGRSASPRRASTRDERVMRAARPARLPLQRRRASAASRTAPTADGRALRPLDHSGDPVRPAHDSVPRVSRRPGHARGRRCCGCSTSISTRTTR